MITFCCAVTALVLTPCRLNAQSSLSLELNGPANAHYSLVRSGEHISGNLITGRPENLNLQRFQEYSLAVYAKDYEPWFVSFDTRQQNLTAVNITATLRRTDEVLSAAFPVSRIVFQSPASSSLSAFDIEKVQGKADALAAISSARDILVDFYLNNKLTAPYLERRDDVRPDRVEQSSLTIARLMYAAEQEWKNAASLSENAARSVDPAECSTVERYWRFRVIEYRRAMEYQRWRVQYFLALQAIRELQGHAFDQRAYREAANELELAVNRYEISLLQSRSRYAECMSRSLMASIDSLEATGQAASVDARQQRLQLERARLGEQSAIAYRMYRKHNEQAMLLTGTEQWEELANAQKQIANYNRAQLMSAEVRAALSTIDLERNPGNAAYARALQRANADVERWADIKHQSDMAYAEWMWALRRRIDVPSVADELFSTHSRLLDIASVARSPEENTARSDTDDLHQAGLDIRTGGDDNTRILRFGQDTYEIIRHRDGTYSYRKNDRPITSLTYTFETERLFGEFLNNVREEEDKNRLRRAFRRVSGLE